MKSYRDLEIYQLAYQQGSQIRRSSKSIKDNIAEGYGRKRYKAEFIRFLVFAHSSCDEALSQLNMISDIYYPDNPLTVLINKYELLGKKINKFIQYVEDNWK